MINAADSHTISQIFSAEIPVLYEIPKYQREFVWGREQWEALFNDLYDNDPGHFLGSIICISRVGNPLKPNRAEIVDGQQRLTSLALMYCTVYERLKRFQRDDEDFSYRRSLLKRRLLVDGRPRLTLSSENYNDLDFEVILDEVGLYRVKFRPPHVGNRRLYKAFNFFRRRVQEFDYEELVSFIDRIDRALLVKIEVSSHADAFALFESLNNRGLPLSAIDIIKNKILACLDRSGALNIDDAYLQWNQMVHRLPDYATQERFLRHYYNAFQFRPEVKVPGVKIARRSNLIKVYERLVDTNSRWIFEELMEKSKYYARYVDQSEENSPWVLDLQRIGATPAYALLLYLDVLWGRDQDERKREEVSKFLVKYFVRRNLTDYPPTRDLDMIFVELIENCENSPQEITPNMIISYLRHPHRCASDRLFREKLEGDIYLENSALARFLLCKVEESHLTHDFKPALWEKDQFGHYRMTVEHILPEGRNLPQEWVEMISGGDRERARSLQHEWCHKLGNLTLTAYNPYLSNYPFEKKRDRVDGKGRYVGYRNGLYLNRQLANRERWTPRDIKNRTRWLVNEILDIFRLESPNESSA